MSLRKLKTAVENMNSYKLIIKGLVQGVGFRPFIYNLAKKFDLKGEVYNEALGVIINIYSSKDILDKFIEKIKKNKPVLSHIDSIDVVSLDSDTKYNDFAITQSSKNSKVTVTMPLDTCMCEDCKKELNDKNNRRYNYPFINCTNCGPRYTLIKKLPYDREDTTMDLFEMCDECKDEYTDPTNRRYHTQITACKKCGPRLILSNSENTIDIKSDQIISKSVELLKDGYILAVKGIGGFHLMCDATNEKSVQTLRDRKNRPHKPFAVMVKDLKTAKKIAYINKKEQELLTSNKRPIVLLKKIADKSPLVDSIAPKIDKIGLFLPYTPLHQLILDSLDRPLIATSANKSGDPICLNKEDIDGISDIWDYCVDHNREILNGCDDSVVAIVDDEVVFLRTARGYAPLTFSFKNKKDKNILALGANQKSTISIMYKDKIVTSPYIGDLDTIKSIQRYKNTIKSFEKIYDFKPDILLCDKHKSYESTKYAKKLQDKNNQLKIKYIQHHYAHTLAVIGEKKIDKKVLSVAFDGTGLGGDDTLWGGEFIYGDTNSYDRVTYLKPFKLLGGSIAIKEPRRVALSLMFEIYGKESLKIKNIVTNQFSSIELCLLYNSWEKSINSPLTSSFGRLFDAVGSIADIAHIITYEGQSGSQMESYYDKCIKESYNFSIENGIINVYPMINEMFKQNDKKLIVSKFFNTIVKIIQTISKEYEEDIVLCGGVFQNITLTTLIKQNCKSIILNNNYSLNDGAISFGQIIKEK